MFKKTLYDGGITSRCRYSTLLLAFLAISFSNIVLAQDEHGAGISGNCTDITRTCDAETGQDTDCADGLLCTNDVCDETNTQTTINCTFSARWANDDFEDTLHVVDADHIVDPFGNSSGPIKYQTDELKIINITGNAACLGTCSIGGEDCLHDFGSPNELACASAGAVCNTTSQGDIGSGVVADTIMPCKVEPIDGLIPAGSIQFSSTIYEPTMADWQNGISCDTATGFCSLETFGNVKFRDQCDGLPDPGCSSNDAPKSQPMDQVLQTACTNPGKDCDDGLACTIDSCDTATGLCVNDEKDCDDGLACTIDSCDTTTGLCVNDEKDCDDSLACTIDSCDTTTGLCVNDEKDCDDGLACTIDSCDTTTGLCVNDEKDCDDGLACTIDSCDTTTGLCVNDEKDCDDGLACTIDSCDTTTGLCVNDEKDCDDGLACTIDSCDTTTGLCVNDQKDCDDGLLCTIDSCDTTTGLCVNDEKVCDDGDVCTDDSCNTSTGLCVSVDNGTCDGTAICRTPGFWGARGGFPGDGEDKRGKDFYKHGQNITGEVLCDSLVPLIDGECATETDGLMVCGNWITNTKLDDPQSATEAICIKGGDPRAKMLRMLMSASLNCRLGDCNDATTKFIEMCSDVCAYEASDYYGMCHSSLGCFNEGGTIIDEDGTCVGQGEGVCSDDSPVDGEVCTTDTFCKGFGDVGTCVPFDDCHEEPACPDDNDELPAGSDLCFEPVGAASSPGKCNAARQGTKYIFDLPGWKEPTP